MDYNEAIAHKPTVDERIKIAREYRDSRVLAAKAKHRLDILLVANLAIIRETKSNVGIDMAYLMLMDICTDAKEYYKIWKVEEAKYKGLERILTALESKTTFYQSLMKFQRNHD